MMDKLTWEYKVALVFAALSGFFCLLLAGEWWYGQSFREEMLADLFKVNKAEFEMQPIPEYPFIRVPADQFTNFVERPVFFEGRKPIDKIIDANVQQEPVIKPPTEPFDYLLTGIINTPKGIRVLFQDPKASVYADRFKKLKQGDSLAGWKLIEIQTDQVKMQSDSETKEILLLKAKPKTPMPGSVPPSGVLPGGNAINGGMPPIPPNGNPNVNPFNLKH